MNKRDFLKTAAVAGAVMAAAVGLAACGSGGGSSGSSTSTAMGKVNVAVTDAPRISVFHRESRYARLPRVRVPTRP